jgi:hypothetical protein
MTRLIQNLGALDEATGRRVLSVLTRMFAP